MSDELYLKTIKAILLSCKLIKEETELSKKEWLQYKAEGFSPGKAVKEDFYGYKLPFFRYSDIIEIRDGL